MKLDDFLLTWERAEGLFPECSACFDRDVPPDAGPFQVRYCYGRYQKPSKDIIAVHMGTCHNSLDPETLDYNGHDDSCCGCWLWRAGGMLWEKRN